MTRVSIQPGSQLRLPGPLDVLHIRCSPGSLRREPRAVFTRPNVTQTLQNCRASAPRATGTSPQGAPPPPPPPPPRRALGVDYGRKQIGLAVSTMGLAPRPLSNMRGGGLQMLMPMAQGVVDTALAEGCEGIVIGLPVTTSGSLRRRQTDSQQGRRCRNFADAVAALAHNKGLAVYLVDERGTTIEAEALVGNLGGGRGDQRRKKDAVAAALILSLFFNDTAAAVRVRAPKIIRQLDGVELAQGEEAAAPPPPLAPLLTTTARGGGEEGAELLRSKPRVPGGD